MWWIVSAVGIAALQRYKFRGRNAVWGGATIGFFIGIVIAVVRPGFNWETVGHSVVIGAFAGLVAELLGAVGDWLKGDS